MPPLEFSAFNIVNKSKHPLPHYATPHSAGLGLRADLDTPVVLGTGLAKSCYTLLVRNAMARVSQRLVLE